MWLHNNFLQQSCLYVFISAYRLFSPYLSLCTKPKNSTFLTTVMHYLHFFAPVSLAVNHRITSGACE